MDDITELMIKEANRTLQYSYAPYSNYAVAACVCSEDDRLFTGVNVENSSYGLTICAETSAICQMISAGPRKIKSIVLMAGNNMLCAPCGACRQFISEFSTSATRIHLCDKKRILETVGISELLPMAFTLKKN
jgi:cytidine deaminase